MNELIEKRDIESFQESVRIESDHGNYIDNAEKLWADQLNIDAYQYKKDGSNNGLSTMFLCLRETLAIIQREFRCKDLQKPINISESMLNNLEKVMIQKSANWAGNILQDLVTKILVIGQECHNWKFARLPHITYRMPRSPGVLLGPHLLGLSSLRKLEKIYVKSINNMDKLSQEARSGQLIFSFINNSAFINMKWITALMDIENIKWIVGQPGMWANLALVSDEVPLDEAKKVEDRPKPEYTRFLLDQLTELLLYRYLEDFPGDQVVKGKPFTLLRKYFRTCGVEVSNLPNTLKELLLWNEVAHGVQLPPYLLTTLRSKYKTTKLRAATWTRIYIGKAVRDWNDSVALNKKTAAKVKEPILSKEAYNRIVEQKSWLARLGRNLVQRHVKNTKNKKYTKKDITDILKNELEAPPECISKITWLIGVWLYALLENGGKHGRALRINSVKRYLSTLKNYLLPHFCDIRLEDLDGDGWLYNLQYALDHAGDTIAGAVFARFATDIQSVEGIPAFDVAELEGIGGAVRVSANLITPAELEMAVTQIDMGDKRATDRAQLSAALGFYLGLRRSEIIFLRICDLQGTHNPYLWIRTNNLFQVKRISSQRSLPIKALLPIHWFKKLIAFRDRRVSEARKGHSSSSLLFTWPGGSNRHLSAVELLDPIRDQLRQLTGDQSIVFHHLRHSFANWALYRLSLSEWPVLANRTIAGLAHSWLSMEQCRKFRKELTFLDDKDVGVRGLLYIIAALLGHKDVATSMRHYIHIADLMVHQILSSSRYDISESAIRVLAGIDTNNIRIATRNSRWYRLRKKISVDGVVSINLLAAQNRMNYQEIYPDPGLAMVTMHQSMVIRESEVNEARFNEIKLSDIPLLLHDIYGLEKRIQDVSDVYNINPDYLHLLKSTVDKVQNIKTRKGTIKGKNISRFNVYPEGPRNRKEARQVEDLMRKVTAKELVQNIDELVPGLKTFLYKTDPTHSGRILISDPGEARSYRKMLSYLGVRDMDLFVRVYHPLNQDANVVIRAKKYWSSVLSIIEDAIHIVRASKKWYPPRENGMVSIDMLSERVLARKKDISESNEVKIVAHYGLRYYLQLLIYYLGVLDKSIIDDSLITGKRNALFVSR